MSHEPSLLSLLACGLLMACAGASPTRATVTGDRAPSPRRFERLLSAARDASRGLARAPSPLAAEVAERVPQRVEVFVAALRTLDDDAARRDCAAHDAGALGAMLERLGAVGGQATPGVLERLDEWGATLGACPLLRLRAGLPPTLAERLDALETSAIAAWVVDDIATARARLAEGAAVGRQAQRPAIAAHFMILSADANPQDIAGAARAAADCAAAVDAAQESRDGETVRRAARCAVAHDHLRPVDAARALRDQTVDATGATSPESLDARMLWLQSPGVDAEEGARERARLIDDTRRAGPRFLRWHHALRLRAVARREPEDVDDETLDELARLRAEVASHCGAHGVEALGVDGQRGALLNSVGRYDDAIREAQGLCAQADAMGRRSADGCVQSLAVIGSARLMLRRPQACEPLRESVARVEAQHGALNPLHASQLVLLAWCLNQTHHRDEALVAYQRVQVEYERIYGASSVVSLRNLGSVALSEALAGRLDDARRDLTRSLTLLREGILTLRERVAIERLMADTLGLVGQWEEAAALLAHAAANHGAVGPRRSREIRRRYAHALRELGRFREAAGVLRELLEAPSSSRDEHALENACWLADSLRRDGDAREAAAALSPWLDARRASGADGVELALTHAEVLLAQGDSAGALRALPADDAALTPALRAGLAVARADVLHRLRRRREEGEAVDEAERQVASVTGSDPLLHREVERVRVQHSRRR